MYHLREISRAHSSGYENSYIKSFPTLEEAATYVHDVWYDRFCEEYEFPSEWDEEDMGAPFPSKETFTVEAITNMAKNKGEVSLFAYYSNFCFLVPNELILTKDRS